MILVDVQHRDNGEWRRRFLTMDEAVRYCDQIKARGHEAKIRNIPGSEPGIRLDYSEEEEPWIRFQNKK
jgi:hypothetical protein